MHNCKWLFVLLIAIVQNSEDSTASCNPPDQPCSNCTSDPQLETVDSFPVSTYLTWTCNDGFIMQGSGDIVVWVCAMNNTWLGDTPNCTEIICSSPPIPANGFIENSPLPIYRPGDSFKYSCNSGYDLEGNMETSTCLPNGSWTNEEAFCEIRCSDDQIFYQDGNACFEVPAAGGEVKWDEARNRCRNRGGFLAVVKDDNTQNFLRMNLSAEGKLWIGGQAGRHWKWRRDGRYISRLLWNNEEPSNANEKCIEIRNKDSQNDWYDKGCSSENGYICQFDTCSGIPPGNSHQVLYRGDCYQFFDSNSDWADANSQCQSLGGYLTEVLDRSTQDFLSSEISSKYGTDKQWWIGGYEDGSGYPRSWFWIDNTRISVAQWKDEEPNDSWGKEDCIELSNSDERKWNDETCNSDRGYVCQFGLPSCGDPGEPLHGSRSPSDTSTFLDGATIDYSCDPGFEVIGNAFTTCMLNGQWNSDRPVCIAIKCPSDTFSVGNATNVTISSNTYRGVATYTCSSGYIPDASPVSYCQANGTWSYPHFTCTEGNTTSDGSMANTTTATNATVMYYNVTMLYNDTMQTAQNGTGEGSTIQTSSSDMQRNITLISNMVPDSNDSAVLSLDQNTTRSNISAPLVNATIPSAICSLNGTGGLLARSYVINDRGITSFFRGWVDVQGQGAPNDFCRIVRTDGKPFLSCLLAGSREDDLLAYTSPNPSEEWFDPGYSNTWYMKDEDGDGRDDYCRCIGSVPDTSVVCMKAGPEGFEGQELDFMPGGSPMDCFYLTADPYFGFP